MVLLSRSRKSPSSITGTTPTGLILRNSGSSVERKPRPQSSRSYFCPTSSSIHSTLRTLIELARP